MFDFLKRITSKKKQYSSFALVCADGTRFEFDKRLGYGTVIYANGQRLENVRSATIHMQPDELINITVELIPPRDK